MADRPGQSAHLGPAQRPQGTTSGPAQPRAEGAPANRPHVSDRRRARQSDARAASRRHRSEAWKPAHAQQHERDELDRGTRRTSLALHVHRIGSARLSASPARRLLRRQREEHRGAARRTRGSRRRFIMLRSSSFAPVAKTRKYVITAGESTVSQAHGVPATGDQEHAPPHAGVAEVVRVPGVAPQPAVHHGSTVRVLLVRRQLRVARPTRRPSRPATARRPAPAGCPRSALGGRGDLDRQRHEPHRDALGQEDPRHREAERLPLEHRGVARVLLRRGDDADDRRARRAAAPRRRPCRAAPTAPAPSPTQRAEQGDQHEAEAPDEVHHDDASDATGDEGGHGHQDGDQAGRSGGRGSAPHHGRTSGSVCAPPGRTIRIWSTPIRPSRKAIDPPTR